MGNEPALSPSQLVYQRLLAGDPVEAIDQAQEFLKDNSLIEYYDDILLEGIRLAGLDERKGLLEEDRAVRIKETVAPRRLRLDMPFVGYGERFLMRSFSSHFWEITLPAKRQINYAKRQTPMRLRLHWKVFESAWSVIPKGHLNRQS